MGPAALALLLSLAVGAAGVEAGAARRALAGAFLEGSAPAPWTAPGLAALLAGPSWPPVNVTQGCARDLAVLLRDFVKREYWALKMFDASTKIPEGLLYGHLTHLGNFDECLSLKKGDSSGPPDFDGQHCLVSIEVYFSVSDGAEGDDGGGGGRSEADAAAAAATIAQLHLGKKISPNIFTYFPLQVSWCVPSSCKPADLQEIATAALDVLPGNTTVTVSPSMCHTNVKKMLRGIDIFAICVLALFIACAVASTIYDRLTRRRAHRPPLLLSFSLLSNWPKLVAVTSGPDQLSCLNGIRTISIGWVVLGHVYLANVTLPTSNLMGFAPDFLKSFNRLIITNGTLSVDSFFVMSGLLLSFLFFKEIQKGNRFSIIKFYVHRYVRLTPSLAILIFLTTTILSYAATGPLWDINQEGIRGDCEKNWWTNLLYVNNFIHESQMCLPHTWYLAVDMQLYWLSPLVLLPLWKLPRRYSLMWVCLLMLVGWAVPFTVAYTKELSPSFISTKPQQMVDTTKFYYFAPYCRYVAWLLGVMLGYILHESRKKRIELPRWSIAVGWFLSSVLMTVALDADYPFQQPDHVYSRVEAAFWLSLFRPMWALGLCWIIFACDQGYGGLANKILSWNFFQPLARLSYGVYLTHILVLNLLAGAVQTPTYFSDIFLIPQFFGVLLMSVVWTIPLTLLFESPFIQIEKIISKGASWRPSEQLQYHNFLEEENEREDTINS